MQCDSRAFCVVAGCSLPGPPDPPGTAGGSASHLVQKDKPLNGTNAMRVYWPIEFTISLMLRSFGFSDIKIT